MKTKLLNQNTTKTPFFSFILLIFFVNIGWGQQGIGVFPNLDGGMEGQTATTSIVTSGSTGPTTTTSWSISSSTNASTRTLYNAPADARSGNFYAGIQQTATATNLRLQSPTPAPNLFASATKYTIQFWYKSATDPGVALTSGIYFNGTVSSTSSTPAATVVGGFTANTWTKGYSTITYTPASMGTLQWAVVRLSAAAGVYTALFNVDDFVVYEGDLDTTIPDSGSTPALTSSGLVSWNAPSSGIDNGGYVVVRYTTTPNPDNDPNQNGIYQVGNTITNGTSSLSGTVAYVGTSTSFTDANYVAGSNYKIYTVDKAFNYSNEITASLSAPATITSSTTFAPFTYVLGNGPSTSQSTVITGTNLTNPISLNTTTLANFEVSLDNFATAAATGTITVASGSTLSVRLKSGLTTAASYTDSAVLTSGSTVLSLSCSGTVTAAATITSSTPFAPFTYVFGNGPSTSQSTAITGTNLTNPISLNTTTLANFEVSLDNFATAAATGTITVASGSTLSVRLKSGLTTAASYTDSVVLTSGSTVLSLSCSGTVTANLSTRQNNLTTFTLYPNPSNDTSFNTLIPDEAGKASLIVTNLLGEKIYSQANLQSGNVITINVPNIKTTGVYLVSFTSEDKTTTTKWIVK
jgi:hypothetical protein